MCDQTPAATRLMGVERWWDRAVVSTTSAKSAPEPADKGCASQSCTPNWFVPLAHSRMGCGALTTTGLIQPSTVKLPVRFKLADAGTDAWSSRPSKNTDCPTCPVLKAGPPCNVAGLRPSQS